MQPYIILFFILCCDVSMYRLSTAVLLASVYAVQCNCACTALALYIQLCSTCVCALLHVRFVYYNTTTALIRVVMLHLT
jgi:hypothetical protein